MEKQVFDFKIMKHYFVSLEKGTAADAVFESYPTTTFENNTIGIVDEHAYKHALSYRYTDKLVETFYIKNDNIFTELRKNYQQYTQYARKYKNALSRSVGAKEKAWKALHNKAVSEVVVETLEGLYYAIINEYIRTGELTVYVFIDKAIVSCNAQLFSPSALSDNKPHNRAWLEAVAKTRKILINLKNLDK